MMFVEPIRSVSKVNAIKNLLRGKGDFRNLLLFQLALTSALRASDVLRVKVGNIFKEDGTPRESFETKEKKTGKYNRIPLTAKTKSIMAEYAAKHPDIVSNPENFIFFQKKTFPLGSAGIGRKTFWLLMNTVAKDVGLEGRYGSHSCRKSFGYLGRMNGIPIEIIQHKLNHSSLEITRRYLGITMKEIEDATNKLDL